MSNEMSFITVGLNPTLQKTLLLPRVRAGRVNRCGECRFDAAGKALNMCRVLTQLGKKCVHLTQLGGSLRPIYLDLCKKDGLDIRWAESNSAIRFCYTIIGKDKRQVTELVEEGEAAGEGAQAGLLEALDRLLPDASVLIIGGSKTAGFSDSLIPEMVSMAKKRGLFVIMDTRGPDLINSLPYRPDIIKPNLEEFACAFAAGKKLSKKQAASLCREIWKQHGCSIVLTRGAQNIWYSQTGTLEEFPVQAVDPINSTGSGDAFTAGLAAALNDGASFRAALAEGSHCGRQNALLLQPGSIV